MMDEKLDKKITAGKGLISGGVAAGGGVIGYAIVLIAKCKGIELSAEDAAGITVLCGAVVSGAGRAVENAVRFYAKLKKIAAEK